MPKSDFYQLYYVDKLSMKGISQRYGISMTAVRHLFDTYDLRTRSLKEAMALLKKPTTKHRRARMKALTRMGAQCVHCGCDDSRLLEIHHKNGGGGKDRHAVGGSNFIYSIVMGRRQLDDLEVFCKPCHAIEEVKRLFGVNDYEIHWKGT